MLSIHNSVSHSIISIQNSHKNVIINTIIRIILFVITFCGEALGDNSAMYIGVTLYWGYWLYCDYFIWWVSCIVGVV